MSSIKHIIFDFGGVLGADANSWVWKKDPDVLTKTGLSNDEIKDLFWQHWNTLKDGKEDLQAFFIDVAKHSKENVSTETLRQLYHRNITLHEDVFELVKELEKNYKLYILANESLEGMQFKIDQFRLEEHFAEIFNSADLGLSKPDEQIFKTVIEKMNAPVESILFIDDQEKNVQAAQRVGIESILFTNAEKLKEALSPLLTSKG